MRLYIFEETTSTNDLGKRESFSHASAIWALYQSAGRGQRGNRWVGGVDDNIAFSVVLEPSALPAVDQFLLSQITALALHGAMSSYGVECSIKWTNDIYVEDRKLAGVLIENTLREGRVVRSVVGIGLNINQIDFDPMLPNPTSMAIVTTLRFDREEVLRTIHAHLMELFAMMERWEIDSIRERYNALLYRRGEMHYYRLPGGELFRARLEGVAPRGDLMLCDERGERQGYQFREVEFVIDGRDK